MVRGDNITKGFLRWEEKTRYWKSVTPDIEEYLLKGDDVLVSMDGALVGRNFAKVTRGDLPLLLVQRVARLRAINGLNQEFLFYLIQHPRFERHIDSVKTHMAIPHFSPDDLRSYRVPIPDRPAEQRQIAEMLASVDFKLERETISRQHLARLRRGLTDLLLTGKVRIKVS